MRWRCSCTTLYTPTLALPKSSILYTSIIYRVAGVHTVYLIFLEPLRRGVRVFVGTRVVCVLSREAVIGWLFELEEKIELRQFVREMVAGLVGIGN